MDFTICDQKFDGSDPIRVLRFLADFSSECDTIAVTEGQEFIVLSYMLKGTEKDTLVSVRGHVEEDEDGVTF